MYYPATNPHIVPFCRKAPASGNTYLITKSEEDSVSTFRAHETSESIDCAMGNIKAETQKDLRPFPEVGDGLLDPLRDSLNPSSVEEEPLGQPSGSNLHNDMTDSVREASTTPEMQTVEVQNQDNFKSLPMVGDSISGQLSSTLTRAVAAEEDSAESIDFNPHQRIEDSICASSMLPASKTVEVQMQDVFQPMPVIGDRLTGRPSDEFARAAEEEQAGQSISTNFQNNVAISESSMASENIEDYSSQNALVEEIKSLKAKIEALESQQHLTQRLAACGSDDDPEVEDPTPGSTDIPQQQTRRQQPNRGPKAANTEGQTAKPDSDEEDSHVKNGESDSEYEERTAKRTTRKRKAKPKPAYQRVSKRPKPEAPKGITKKLEHIGEAVDEHRENPSEGLDFLYNPETLSDMIMGSEGVVTQPEFENTGTTILEQLKQIVARAPRERQEKAKKDIKLFRLAVTIFPKRNGESLELQPGCKSWKLPGMKTPMFHGQILGAALLRIQEEHPNYPNGGILADACGHGKTLMMLANIVSSIPSKTSKGPRATLIAAPLSVRDQWYAECGIHCETHLTVAKWAAIKATADPTYVEQNCDIIFATHDELLDTSKQKQVNSKLKKVNWLRIVVDEGHVLQDHNSEKAKFLFQLPAKFRWAMSGSPLVNGTGTLFSYSKFIRVDGIEDTGIRQFNQQYTTVKNKEPHIEGIENVQKLLGRIMIRRDHGSTLFGFPIVKLPPATEKFLFVTMNKFEEAIYERALVRVRDAIIAEAERKKGNAIQSLVKNAAVYEAEAGDEAEAPKTNGLNILNMLAILRKCANHPALAEADLHKYLDPKTDVPILLREAKKYASDPDVIRNELLTIRNRLASTKHEVFDPLKKIPEQRRGKSSGLGIDSTLWRTDRRVVDDEVNDDEALGLKYRKDEESNYGSPLCLSSNWIPLIKQIGQTGDVEDPEEPEMPCGDCGLPPEQPFELVQCKHVLCLLCADKLCKKRGRAKKCPECDILVTQDMVMKEKEVKEKKMKRPSWFSMMKALRPSSKLLAAKAQVMNWKADDPHCKILVFSNHQKMLDLFKKMCDWEMWTAVEINGGMNASARGKAIEEFRDKNGTICLIMTKAGGVGLNLTMANKVLIMDPWWNEATEIQAFCRTWRIGQDKVCELVRIFTNNTIETEMLCIQQDKQAIINLAMLDGAGVKAILKRVFDLSVDNDDKNEDESDSDWVS